MRIAYFSDTFYPQINGVANTLSQLKKYLDKRKTEYMFYVPDYENETPVKEDGIVRSKGLPLIFYNECRMSLPWLPRLFRLMDAFKPDLIHLVTEFGIGLMGRHYARTKPVQTVSSYHTNIDSYVKYYTALDLLKEGVNKYFKWFHSISRKVFVPTEDTASKLEGIGLTNLGIWSRGIDTDLFSPRKRTMDFKMKYGLEDRTVFLYVGRVSTEKDIDILPRAMQLLNERNAGKASLVVTGDGPYLQTLKRETPEGTVFTGFLRGEELAQAYASSDIFITPSSTETFGNVALEAMASGLPVITADAGGFKHIVQNGIDGYRCTVRNPEDFAHEMERLLIQPELARQMGDNALLHAKERSWDSVFDKLMDDYQEIGAMQKMAS